MAEVSEFVELDGAARANLRVADQAEFHRYKAQLIREGHDRDDLDAILTGFIWSCIEEYE